MGMNNLNDLIAFFKPKLIIAGNTPPYSDVMKLTREFISEAKSLDDVEDEITTYFKDNIISNEWENEDLWIWAAITSPSEKYLKYYLQIITINNEKIPYWRILDALTYMPKNLNLKIAEGVKAAISLNNSCWNDEGLKKAFEVLINIGTKEDIDYISSSCKSKNEKISSIAQYWLDWLNEDEE
ncbi:hypothetical protein [Anaerocolumna jejuensis]|uniref:hypothetical protein n=1 Tax=Anaerocolumna jejuensis TaxID=259063 RepID=UPI003F7C4E82